MFGSELLVVTLEISTECRRCKTNRLERGDFAVAETVFMLISRFVLLCTVNQHRVNATSGFARRRNSTRVQSYVVTTRNDEIYSSGHDAVVRSS